MRGKRGDHHAVVCCPVYYTVEKCLIFIVVSWNFQTMGDAAAENASAIDAINYFSEMQLQSEIEKARARKYSLKRSDGEDEKARNTVLILPVIET